MKSFLLMLTFLTRIPIPITFEFDEKTFIKGVVYFPIIGVIIGGLLSLITLFNPFLPREYLNFLIIVAYLIIVGGLHIDGLADVCDGIFSCRKKERVFEIMSDSLVGTFGVIALVLYFLGLYIFLEPSFKVVFAFPIVGRVMGLFVSGVFRYAKETGMGKAMVDSATYVTAIGAVVFGSIITFLLGEIIFIAFILTLIMSYIIAQRINRFLGGITGDVIGCVIEVSQVIFLIFIAIGGVLWTYIS
ncbi:cobalamin-5'-phosphate synthase [Natranaerovirga hydrolytica]|uniref:Adenosylcobinamide-GDP ribazoletransferase n=1 Tax=Natranaerovirga hydrolytica TaxID=680378 RepID=A0A4R1MZC4_9FIRM|nr:adenosylcobinamide-GDP ribazoletransferase [Natranaerovirga hydrolytica]TCK98626.1 cobalamin-5'-phosphate synthase [Natranaerovirga hydrolytica]